MKRDRVGNRGLSSTPLETPQKITHVSSTAPPFCPSAAMPYKLRVPTIGVRFSLSLFLRLRRREGSFRIHDSEITRANEKFASRFRNRARRPMFRTRHRHRRRRRRGGPPHRASRSDESRRQKPKERFVLALRRNSMSHGPLSSALSRPLSIFEAVPSTTSRSSIKSNKEKIRGKRGNVGPTHDAGKFHLVEFNFAIKK